MSDLNALIAKRGQIKAQLTRFATYLRTNGGDNMDFDQVKLRAAKAKQTWKEFRCVQLQIEEEDIANEDNERYRDEFENLYFKNMAKSDHDIFSALVHNNDKITDIQKFFYLQSSLSGDAESVIKCLQTTADNYNAAWNSLIERYDNKKVLIQVHMQAIFDSEPIKKKSSSQLRKLVDALSGHMKALESLGERPSQCGTLLMHLVVSKLDAKTMREWEISSSKTEVSSISNLTNFIQSRFRVLEAVETSQQINPLQENNRMATCTNKRKGKGVNRGAV